MNHQPPEDLQRRLENLEAQINSASVDMREPPKNTQTSQPAFLHWKSRLTQLQLWFENLNGITKVIVGGAGVLLGLAILQALLRLVASVISVAVLGFLLYLGYKFFVSGNSQKKQ
jgi:purine-cytosine permease-like protein